MYIILIIIFIFSDDVNDDLLIFVDANNILPQHREKHYENINMLLYIINMIFIDNTTNIIFIYILTIIMK